MIITNRSYLKNVNDIGNVIVHNSYDDYFPLEA